jgi:aspartate 4-decarboxylase
MKQSRLHAKRSTARVTQRALGRLDPFELKNRLIARAAAQARRSAGTLLNAGRGNPDWLLRPPRAAFHLLGRFALDEAGAMRGSELGQAPGLGAAPRVRAIAARLRRFLDARNGAPGAALLHQALRSARRLGCDADAFVHELVDGVLGDHYPEPVRMLSHAERVVRAYLESEGVAASRRATLRLFAVEGATAGICYVFDTLIANRLLRRGDRIALATPIFSPYVELVRDVLRGFKVVELEASALRPDGSHRWQFPDAEIDRLADRRIKLLVVVNPSNPPSVAMHPRSVARLARVVRRRNPDLMVVSDDVYATFVPGYRSLLAALPRNTIGIYSFSKHFGATGWRLGVVALHADHVVERRIAAQPRRRRRAVAQRYAPLVLEPETMAFIDRMVAESRAIALNHTAGLSAPQQVQMTLLALYGLSAEGRRTRAALRALVGRRLRALYRGLDVALPVDPLRAGYYCELDLALWAERHHGPDFANWLRRSHEPVDFVLRLAERSAVVLMPCAAFGGPPWSVRVSLANLPAQAYGAIGRHLAALAREYLREWRQILAARRFTRRRVPRRSRRAA